MRYIYHFNVNLILEQNALDDWINDGPCNSNGEDPTCGPGTQLQKRTCTDGTDICPDEETQKTVTCAEAGTQLPQCSAGIIPRFCRPLRGFNKFYLICGRLYIPQTTVICF